jgi:hypothetical protein
MKRRDLQGQPGSGKSMIDGEIDSRDPSGLSLTFIRHLRNPILNEVFSGINWGKASLLFSLKPTVSTAKVLP